MSKRYIFPQQNGERKKAKLDITISDHNFPLSQNGHKAEPDQNNWGDDNDDEILLLASQACEDAYNDVSSLPDYSLCMQPGSSSTQLFEPGPSTSKTNFTFKRPSALPSNIVSTNLKDKCNRISSPLPGMSSKVMPRTPNIDLSDCLIFNDKIFKGQDSDYVYKQLLQLQEENTKLKSENGKLLEKCVTKEGEASILRTQLKSCQTAVDNARMDRIKAQEKVQMEWTEKLTTANGQMHDLRTQLDFKNLEIISIKEKCKMLESNKIKLTQVTVENHINSSYRHNISTAANDYSSKRVKMTTNSVQTEDKAEFIKLNKSCRTEPSTFTSVLPVIFEPTTEQHSLLEYNEKLQKHTDLSQNKCRIYSTFHRIPSTPSNKEDSGNKFTLNCLYEDLSTIAAGNCDDKCFDNILTTMKAVLTEVLTQLEQIAQKMTTAFQKEMDEKYIEHTATFLVVEQKELLGGRPIYKEEQAILARRLTGILAHIIPVYKNEYSNDQEKCAQIMDVIRRICQLLDSTSCALLYSGLLLSITNITHNLEDNTKNIEIIKHMISSRPMTFISCKILKLLRKMSVAKNFINKLCPGGGEGNLRLDYDQGVLLYKKDSCYLQVLLKQVETALRCIERQDLRDQAADTTTQLIGLHSHLNDCYTITNKNTGCDCQLVLVQVMVYSLRICAVYLKQMKNEKNEELTRRLLVTCRSGIRALYLRSLRDVELCSQLGHNEGHLQEFCEVMRLWDHTDSYANMLSELSGTFQSSPEDMTSSFHRQPWLNSFKNFAIAD